jgi:hypothetical protein
MTCIFQELFLESVLLGNSFFAAVVSKIAAMRVSDPKRWTNPIFFYLIIGIDQEVVELMPRGSLTDFIRKDKNNIGTCDWLIF